MKNSELIERLQAMPPDAEVLQGVAFGVYHTVDGIYYHTKEHKVSMSGWLWTGDK